MKRCLYKSALWLGAVIFIFESVRWWGGWTWAHWMAPALIYGLVAAAAVSDHWPEEDHGP